MIIRSMKKGLCGILAAASVLTIGTSAMAESKYYSFYSGNTGQTYNSLDETANRKVYDADTWSLKVKTISFSSSDKGYGIALCSFERQQRSR